jgi:D-cysteine desulfhydrase/L-cysteate sulfo-lyase
MESIPRLTVAEIRDRLARVPRVRLAHLPTPLERLPRLSAAVGGVTIFVKRDDCTGLACGGNKARHNEFIFGDALAKGADLFVWGAGVQSNNCRQTAAACAKLGLDCHLILGRNRPFGDGPDPVQGNLLLDHILGATIEIVEEGLGSRLEARIAATAERYRAAGRRPYFWDSPVVKPLAALSYVDAVAELWGQWPEDTPPPAAIYVSSAGSTGAGAALGVDLLGWNTRLRSIAPLQWEWDTRREMADTAAAAARLLGLEIAFPSERIDVDFGQIPPGYGKASEAGLEAIALAARTEGLLLDPTYTGKALAGLIADIRSGALPPGSSAVLIHTGGIPGIFAQHQILAEKLQR